MRAGREGESVKNAFPGGVLTRCHTKTLWTMAHPQNTMPRPMKTDVTIAGVEWNWMNVYRIMPADHTRNEINIYRSGDTSARLAESLAR